MNDMANSPKYLYRYRSLDGDAKEWVRESILDSKHYFSSPKSFNDPFDCRPVFSLEATKAELISYYEKILSHQIPTMSREQRRAQARVWLRNPESDPRNPRNLDSFHQNHYEMVSSRIGVLCLSETPRNILMWSHYGNSHRGICLQFHALENTLETSQPVHYKELRPTTNPVSQSQDEMLDDALFTKSDQWAYEREWRIIQYKRGAGIYRTPVDALVGVILGAQIESSDKRDVIG